MAFFSFNLGVLLDHVVIIDPSRGKDFVVAKKKNNPFRAINAIDELEERYGCAIREDCLSNWCSIRNR